MKRFFLIDKENTGNRFLVGVNELTSEDTLVLFQHSKAPPMGEGVWNILRNSKAKLQVVKMQAHTKNAMDFQICTYLGFLVNQYGTCANYYIVSNDSGYLASMEFIKSTLNPEVTLEMISTCSLNGTKSNLIPFALGKNYSSDTVKVIKMGLKKTSSTKDLHVFLQKTLKEDGPVIYNLIKPIYKEALKEVAV